MLKNYKKLDYQSLKDEEKEEKIVFHLLSDFIKKETLEKLKTLEKELSAFYPTKIQPHILSDEIFKNYPKYCGNYMTYFRFYIPHILSAIDRALYLDVDMVACADIRALWSLDLTGVFACTIRDWVKHAHEKRIALKAGEENFDFGDYYFNAGFLFFNLKKSREENLVEKCIYFLSNYKVIAPDQDALNYAIRENTSCVLPFSFNNMNEGTHIHQLGNAKIKSHYAMADLKFWSENTVILHLAGGVKPWENPFIMQNEKGEYIGLYYVAAAKQSFCFANDATQNLFVYAQQTDIARSILQYANNIFGLFFIPFIIQKIKIRNFVDLNEVLEYLKNQEQNPIFQGLDYHGKSFLIKELYSKYEKVKNSGFLYLLKLPFAILKAKNWAKKSKFC